MAQGAKGGRGGGSARQDSQMEAAATSRADRLMVPGGLRATAGREKWRPTIERDTHTAPATATATGTPSEHQHLHPARPTARAPATQPGARAGRGPECARFHRGRRQPGTLPSHSRHVKSTASLYLHDYYFILVWFGLVWFGQPPFASCTPDAETHAHRCIRQLHQSGAQTKTADR